MVSESLTTHRANVAFQDAMQAARERGDPRLVARKAQSDELALAVRRSPPSAAMDNETAQPVDFTQDPALNRRIASGSDSIRP